MGVAEQIRNKSLINGRLLVYHKSTQTNLSEIKAARIVAPPSPPVQIWTKYNRHALTQLYLVNQPN